MTRTIIVSDLHVDTWTDRKIGAAGKTKMEYFLDFIESCKRGGVTRFVLNGDLMDFPPYEGYFSFRGSKDMARDVVEKLMDLSKTIPVTYIIGNHDIGISGLRSAALHNISPFKNVDFVYPYHIIKYPNRVVMLEHGHFCDPSMALYIKDLCDRTYREVFFEAIRWTASDEIKNLAVETGDKVSGRLAAVEVAEGNLLYDAVSADLRVQSDDGIMAKIEKWGGQGIGQNAIKWLWRNHAFGHVKKYMDYKISHGGTPEKHVCQIFGHTHRADVGKIDIDGVHGTYLNSGTWTGECDSCSYIDVDADGKPWLHDWISDPAEQKRL